MNPQEIITLPGWTDDWKLFTSYVAMASETGKDLSIYKDGDSVKVKVGAGVWSPPLFGVGYDA